MKKFSLILIIGLNVFFTSAQNRNCGTMEHLNEIRQNDPKIDARMENENKAIKNWIANNSKSTPTIFAGVIFISERHYR